MNNFLSYLRRNRFRIIVIILFVVFIYTLVHTANDAYIKMEQEQIENVDEQGENSYETSIRLTKKECETIIEDFVKNCVNGNYEKAYTYLSKESLEQYSSVNEFGKNYCEKNALKGKGYKIVKKENSNNYTYDVEFNNLLSSGNRNVKKFTLKYTVVVENGQDIRVKIER